jgi:hypothetical protein
VNGPVPELAITEIEPLPEPLQSGCVKVAVYIISGYLSTVIGQH